MAEVTWTTGDFATATKLNQMADQCVTTCTSSTRPTGIEGRLIFETDTDRVMIYDGTGWRQFGGSSWNDFTPSWNNLTVGNASVNDGAWHYTDGGAIVRVSIIFGSTSSISTSVSLDVPGGLSTRSDGVRTIGQVHILDSSSGVDYDGTSLLTTAGSTISLYAGDNVTSTNPMSWATGDQIHVTQFVPLT